MVRLLSRSWPIDVVIVPNHDERNGVGERDGTGDPTLFRD